MVSAEYTKTYVYVTAIIVYFNCVSSFNSVVCHCMNGILLRRYCIDGPSLDGLYCNVAYVCDTCHEKANGVNFDFDRGTWRCNAGCF